MIDKSLYIQEYKKTYTILATIELFNNIIQKLIDNNNIDENYINSVKEIINEINTKIETLTTDLGNLGNDVSQKLDKNGDSMSGNINMTNYAIQGLSNGVIKDLIHFDIYGNTEIGNNSARLKMCTNERPIISLPNEDKEVAYYDDYKNVYRHFLTFISENKVLSINCISTISEKLIINTISQHTSLLLGSQYYNPNTGEIGIITNFQYDNAENIVYLTVSGINSSGQSFANSEYEFTAIQDFVTIP